MTTANYKGPVVYIVHSPSQKPEPEVINHPLEAKDLNHLKKIEKLLRFAGEHNLPVFWEVINEYQEKEEWTAFSKEWELKKEDFICCTAQKSQKYGSSLC